MDVDASKGQTCCRIISLFHNHNDVVVLHLIVSSRDPAAGHPFVTTVFTGSRDSADSYMEKKSLELATRGSGSSGSGGKPAAPGPGETFAHYAIATNDQAIARAVASHGGMVLSADRLLAELQLARLEVGNVARASFSGQLRAATAQQQDQAAAVSLAAAASLAAASAAVSSPPTAHSSAAAGPKCGFAPGPAAATGFRLELPAHLSGNLEARAAEGRARAAREAAEADARADARAAKVLRQGNAAEALQARVADSLRRRRAGEPPRSFQNVPGGTAPRKTAGGGGDGGTAAVLSPQPQNRSKFSASGRDQGTSSPAAMHVDAVAGVAQWAHARGWDRPAWAVEPSGGADKTFTAFLSVGPVTASGTGSTKREAKQKAAQDALGELGS